MGLKIAVLPYDNFALTRASVLAQEVLKQRIQADIYPNLAVALPAVLKDKGIAGLYK